MVAFFISDFRFWFQLYCYCRRIQLVWKWILVLPSWIKWLKISPSVRLFLPPFLIGDEKYEFPKSKKVLFRFGRVPIYTCRFTNTRLFWIFKKMSSTASIPRFSIYFFIECPFSSTHRYQLRINQSKWKFTHGRAIGGFR